MLGVAPEMYRSPTVRYPRDTIFFYNCRKGAAKVNALFESFYPADKEFIKDSSSYLIFALKAESNPCWPH